MPFKYTDVWNTTIASIAGGTGITSFTVTSASGAPTLGAGEFAVARIADGTGSAENIIITGISGTTITCLATTVAHANGDAFAGGILSSLALNQFKDDAISGYPETAHTGAGTLVLGLTNRITLTSANATMVVPNGTYKGQMCRVAVDRSSTKLVTLDPSGATTIDGATTRIMWAGEVAYLAWTGTEWEKRGGIARPMKCIMRLTADQIPLSDVTMTKVNLNSADVDNTGLMANTGSNRIDILRPSDYSLNGDVIIQMNSGSDAFRCLGTIFKNGSQFVGDEGFGKNSGFPSFHPSEPSTPLSAGDYIELDGYQASGTSVRLYGSTTGDSCKLKVTEVPSW
jgi:hypothetical protein